MTFIALPIIAVSFIIAFFSIKKIIFISFQKHLFDDPREIRKIHLTKVPNLGGAAIFAATLLASSLFLQKSSILQVNYILCSAVILFMVGLTDDLIGVDPF